MSQTRRLLDGTITYSAAKDEESNLLHELKYPEHKTQFFALLEGHKHWLRSLVAFHLNLPVNACKVAESGEWLHGSRNVCIPVTVRATVKLQSGHRVMLRFPLPYRVGELSKPGSGDEKTRCEAGAYAWLEENCPDIPIPRLYGFGMGTGEAFTRLDHLPFVSRWMKRFQRIVFYYCGRPISSRYIRRQPHSSELNIPYLLIEYIDASRGKILSSTWNLQKENNHLRTNLFRDLCNLYLSLARVPLSRIGSFIVDNDGFLLLNNRPLSFEIQELENEGIPIDMPQKWTYSTVDSYILDVLSLHDSRLHDQPNAIKSMSDFLTQASCLATMRTVSPLFFQRHLRRGPFIFSLTDLHPSNIFVDENWHITSLIDLEYACSLPVEMIHPPWWLTTTAVDRIVPEEYDQPRLEFMTLLTQAEQRHSSGTSEFKLSSTMATAWDMGTFWYSLGLTTPSGMCNIFRKQIRPSLNARFKNIDNGDDDRSLEFMPWYWARDIAAICRRKMKDKEAYDIELKQEFED